jgi:hypothetical protein
LLAGIANLRELIQAMRRNIANQVFLKYGVYLLGNLAQSDEIKSQIGIEGGVQLILQVMEMYPSNEGLIENCVYSLAALSFENDINNSFIVACRGIEHLLTAMQNHDQVDDLLESAVCVLCNLCNSNDTNKQLLVNNGGAQAIVECVLNNFNSMELVMTSFRTLGNLAFNSWAIKQVVDAGAVQAIVAGMTVHNEDLDVVDIALKVLCNLATDISPETQAILAAEGAVQAVVEVTAQYHDNLEMVVNAIGCLNNMAVDMNNSTVMIKQGACEAIVLSMSSLSSNTELVASCVSLLAILSTNIPNIKHIFHAGVPQALIHALQKHTEQEITLKGLTAISNLAYNSDRARQIADIGGVSQVISTINSNMHEAAVLSVCYQALSGLCRDEKSAISMAEVTMQRLVTNLAMHINNEDMLSFAYNFLGNLCVTKGAAEYVVSAKIVSPIMSSMHANQHASHLMTRGCRSLENMAYSCKTVKAHMKEEMVIQRCEQWSAATARDDIKGACAAVIAAINRSDEEFVSLPFVSFNRPKASATKSARSIFGDVEGEQKMPVLSEATRNFLQAGKLLLKHSKTAQPRSRHLFVSQDLKWLIWKDPKDKGPVTDNKLKVFKIKTVEVGRFTEQLQRKRFGKFLAKEECCFAILGRNRTIDVEADSELMREKWVHAIMELVAWTKACKAINKQWGEQTDGR